MNEMCGKGMRVGVTTDLVAQGFRCPQVAEVFGAKTGKVLGKLGSADHPKRRQYRQKLKPIET